MLEFVRFAIPVVSVWERFLGPANRFVKRAELCVQLNETNLVGRYILFRKNRVSGALWDTDSAINAFVRINHQKIRTFLEAINRANIHTVGEFAFDAVLCNNVSHSDI